MEKTSISVELPNELNAELEAEARCRLTSKSAVVREILVAHVRRSKVQQPVSTQAAQPLDRAA